MSHTPGPWRVEIQTGDDAEWASKWPTIHADGYVVVGTEGLYGDLDTDIANAKLIARAPEMSEEIEQLKEHRDELLDALQRLVIAMSIPAYDAERPNAMAFAQNAIAKATSK